MFRNSRIIVGVMWWLILLPVTTIAAECFENSPAKSRGMPLTDGIKISNISEDEYQLLSQLIKGMKGFWSGTASEISCKGTSVAPREERHEYKVHVYATTRYMPVEDTLMLKFRATWEGVTRNTSKLENFRFLLTRERLRLDRNTPAGDVETVKIANNFLLINKKNNVRNPAGGVVAQEIVRSYQLTYNTLKIEYYFYSNGLLVLKSMWELGR
ncbi:hypothetical protein [Kaarinaea lacus]